MSSTESSGAPAEATATNPAPEAAFPTFGSTRGSGLARGKGKRPSAPATTSAAPTAYTPTAIEVVTAPREYTNPFAPANPEPVERADEPAAVTEPARPEPVEPAPAATAAPASAELPAATPATAEAPAKSELNILEPERQKQAPAQTWESEGFRPDRTERPRREESPRDESPAEPVDIASIPPQFLYVRPGHAYVPTPRNWGGAPRERRFTDEGAPRHADSDRNAEAPRATAPAAATPEKPGGFLGWLKGLFGGAPAAAEPVTAGGHNGDARREGGEHRRHRGGRNRGGHSGGERRSRGGRGGRSRGGYPPREGSSQGGI